MFPYKDSHAANGGLSGEHGARGVRSARQVETVDGRGTAVTVATATKESRGGDEKLSMDDPKSKLIDPPYRPVTLQSRRTS